MRFKYSIDPKEWQTSYTEKQAFADSLQRAGSLLLPIIVIAIIPILFAIFCLLTRLEQAVAENLSDNYKILLIIAGFALIFTPLILSSLIFKHLFKTAGTFLKFFYALPDSVNMKKVVNLRVYGRPPMPPPLSNLIKFPTIKAKNGKLDPSENWQTQIGGPANLKIDPGNAIYLERGNRFSRVVGQGDAFLELHETIKTVLNTCPQIEEIIVTAWTKDGIRIDIKAKGEFFMTPNSEKDREGNELYEYNAGATRKAVEEALSGGREGHEWSKSAMGKANGLLGEYIASRYLEEIFIASANGGQLLSTETMREILKNINAKLQVNGVSLAYLQIIDVELPEEIKRQRIRIWETGHATHATVTQGEVKAYQLRAQKKALAEMARDMVFTLANGLDRMDTTNFTAKLLTSIYGVINQGMKNPRTYTNSTPKRMPDGVESFPLDEEV